MITTQQEYIVDILQELKDLTVIHHKESDPELSKFNIDWDEMIRLNEEGVLHLTTIRDDEVLIGYSADMLVKSLHYKGYVSICNDGIYMKPEYRHVGITELLIRAADSYLEGIPNVYLRTINTKMRQKAETLLQSLGYKAHEQSWLKIFQE